MSIVMVVGMRALGRAAMLRMRLGRMASFTLVAVRRATRIGSAWGYRIGAGSKDEGTERGNLLLGGWPLVYAHVMARSG